MWLGRPLCPADPPRLSPYFSPSGWAWARRPRKQPPGQPPSRHRPRTPLSVYGAWHCGNDACTWATVRDMTDFDANNHWLIDRGNGQPSVNLVILSFVNPLRCTTRPTTRATSTACRAA